MKSKDYNNCKVNEIAGFFGISSELLRYYDRQGILTPKRDKKINYRRYDWPDFVRMYYIRMLREMEIHLEDVSRLTSSDSVGELQRALTDKYEELETEINRLKHAQYLIQDYFRTLSDSKKLTGTFEAVISPCFILRTIDAPIAEITDDFRVLDSRQMPRLTLIHEGTADLHQKTTINDLSSYDFTVSITDPTGKLSESSLIRGNPHFTVQKPTLCIHAIKPFGRLEKDTDTYDVFRFLCGDSSLSQKYRITGNAVASFISMEAGEIKGELGEIWLPVEEK